MNAATRAPLSAGLGVLMAIAAFVGGANGFWVVALVAAIMVVCISLGWPTLLEIPSAHGTTLVMLLTGFGSIAAASLAGIDQSLGWLALIIAAGVIISFMHQMFRKERSRLTESLTGTISGAVLASLAGGWVAADKTTGDAALIVCAAASLALTKFVMSLPLPSPVRILVGIPAATAVAVGITWVVPGLTPLAGGFLGFGLALPTVGIHYALNRVERADEPLPVIASAAAPTTVAGLVVFVVGRMFLG